MATNQGRFEEMSRDHQARLAAASSGMSWEQARMTQSLSLEMAAPRRYDTPRDTPEMPYVGAPPITSAGGQRQRDMATVSMSAAASSLARANRQPTAPSVPMFMRRDVPVTALGVRAAQATERVFMPGPGGTIVRGLGPAPASTIASNEPLDQVRMAIQAAAAAREADSQARRSSPAAQSVPPAPAPTTPRSETEPEILFHEDTDICTICTADYSLGESVCRLQC